MPIRIAMIAMTTSSSMSVNATLRPRPGDRTLDEFVAVNMVTRPFDEIV
jgi:hypothetical protein